MKLNKSRAFAIEKGKCPEKDGECEFKISTEKILWCHKHAPTDIFYNLRNVPFALSKPCAIFKGLEREGHENSYCYVSKPVRRFTGDETSFPVSEGWVFLVFITSNFEIFDWRFERADGSNNKRPENYNNRFKQLIWPTRA